MKKIVRYLIFLGIALVLLFAFALPGSKKQSINSETRLVVLIVADQFRQEYFDRFGHLLSGGLAYLVRQGVVFDQARFQQADTSTCPGHAALVSGVYPARHGIIGNEWVSREEKEGWYCIEDKRYGRSPKTLLSSTFSDWLKEQYPEAKVYAASSKDRAAVLIGGASADGAYWLDSKNGEYYSSAYYPDAGVKWLKAFNQQQRPWRRFGSSWQAQPLSAAQLKKSGIVDLYSGARFIKRFPHALGNAGLLPDSEYFKDFYDTPFADSLLAEFAMHILASEKLGTDSSTDFLALSFSSLDTVGHTFGPNSREVLDTLLKLDKSLEKLFASIDEQVGLEHVLIAFSSDHGVQTLPELLQMRGDAHAHRVSTEDIRCVQSVGKRAVLHYGMSDLFLANAYLNHEAIREKKLDLAAVQKQIAGWLEECASIERVFTASELEGASLADDPVRARFKRGFLASRSPDFLPLLKQDHLFEVYSGTGHGSPYDYDSHVPLIFAHPGLTPRRVSEPVKPSDLAPTLAAAIGLKVPEDLDGMDLSSYFKYERNTAEIEGE